MVRLRTLLVALVCATSVLGAQPAAADTIPSRSLSDATRRLDQASARLQQLNDDVEQAQGRLDLANRQLETDRTSISKISAELAGLARFQYEQPSLIVRLAAARSLSEVAGDVVQVQIAGRRRQGLLQREQAIRKQDQLVRDQVAGDLARVQTDRDQAAELAATAQLEQATAQQEEVRLRASQLAAQAAVTWHAPPGDPVGAGGPLPAGGVGNHFDYGYCTWYVATRRPIPWFGNAAQWWPNARAYGYPEGYAPQVGAVMVTGESGYGHVAYVESVNGDGSWTVSEMNYVRWGMVSRRTIRPGQIPLLGFIYQR